jgi:3',5'-cyclic AMP phosphodiesterase CpdA
LRLLHLSDLHFGTESPDIVQHLMDSILSLKPDLIVISGDFVQVANNTEFTKAHNFIKSLPFPVFCVPGNHDIPRYDWVDRFFNPYKRYKKFIQINLEPVLVKDQLVIVGLNTSRPMLPHWNWANGAISKTQINHLEKFFTGSGNRYRICVMHHPVHKAEKAPLKVTVFGAHPALKKIHALKVDLVLTGHVHSASITVVKKTVFASASTATSHRLRSQENGFNLIDLHVGFFKISHFRYNGKNFLRAETYQHKKIDNRAC